MSVAVTVKSNVPLAVGVPDSVPVEGVEGQAGREATAVTMNV